MGDNVGVGIVLVLILAFCGFVGGTVVSCSKKSDCDMFGATDFGSTKYECHKAEPQK